MPYHITARHYNPVNPEFTWQFNSNSHAFEPQSVSWEDYVRAWHEGRDSVEIVDIGVEITAQSNRMLQPFSEPAPQSRYEIYTWTTTLNSLDQFSTDLDKYCEDFTKYYYYVIADPSVRTPDFLVPHHFRGTNPARDALSGALADDLRRALCWQESTWRQFNGASKPLLNQNSNGTCDWGCMQINQAAAREIWDWAQNVSRGTSLLAEKRTHAKVYLEQHLPVTEEMMLNETIQRYNGGAYYKWNNLLNKWQAKPPNQYVATIRGVMDAKPWSRSDRGTPDVTVRPFPRPSYGGDDD